MPNGSAMLMRGKSLTCRRVGPKFQRSPTAKELKIIKKNGGRRPPELENRHLRQVEDLPRINMAEPFEMEFVPAKATAPNCLLPSAHSLLPSAHSLLPSALCRLLTAFRLLLNVVSLYWIARVLPRCQSAE